MVDTPLAVGLATAAAFVLVALGELLHARRCARIAELAFGPRRRPAPWTRVVPLLRSVAAGLVAWGLMTLVTLPPKVHTTDKQIAEEDIRHLVLVLDVSPSMRLADAGPTAQQTRADRAHDLIDSLFERVSIGQYRVSIIAVYNGAKPIVIDTKDTEVVRNILGDLPMHFAFKAGKTTLFAGLEEAAKIAKPWPKDSTLVVLVSDGDTVPATGMPSLPPSVSGALVVGVGDPLTGSFIDGRQSRQDVSTLRQLAARLGGEYHNGNKLHVPTNTIRAVSSDTRPSELEQLTRREYALLATLLGTTLLAVLPLLLQLLGSLWRPGVRHRARHGPAESDSGTPGTDASLTRAGMRRTGSRDLTASR